jgi:hypothetical protein
MSSQDSSPDVETGKRDKYLPSAVLQAMFASSDPAMHVLAAGYLPDEHDRERWQIGDIAFAESDRTSYAYCGGGRWRAVLTGVELGRHELPEQLDLVVRDGFPVCSRHPWGERLTVENREPPVGSVVVSVDRTAMVRTASGWTEYEHASMPITWEELLTSEHVVRLAYWGIDNDHARLHPCLPVNAAGSEPILGM